MPTKTTSLILDNTRYDTDSVRCVSNHDCTTIALSVRAKQTPKVKTLASPDAMLWNIKPNGPRAFCELNHPAKILHILLSFDGAYIVLITQQDGAALLIRNKIQSLEPIATILRIPHNRPDFIHYYLASPKESPFPQLIEVTNQRVLRYNFTKAPTDSIFEASTYDTIRNCYTRRGSIISSTASPRAQYLLLKYDETTHSEMGEESYISLCVDPLQPPAK